MITTLSGPDFLQFFQYVKIICGYGECVCVSGTPHHLSFFTLHESQASFIEITYPTFSNDQPNLNFSIDSQLLLKHVEVLCNYFPSNDILGEISLEQTDHSNTILSLTLTTPEFVITLCLEGQSSDSKKLETHCLESYSSWNTTVKDLHHIMNFKASRWEIQIPRKNHINIKGMTDDEHQLFILKLSEVHTQGKKHTVIVDTMYVEMLLQYMDVNAPIIIRIAPNAPVEIHAGPLICFIAPIEESD